MDLCSRIEVENEWSSTGRIIEENVLLPSSQCIEMMPSGETRQISTFEVGLLPAVHSKVPAPEITAGARDAYLVGVGRMSLRRVGYVRRLTREVLDPKRMLHENIRPVDRIAFPQLWLDSNLNLLRTVDSESKGASSLAYVILTCHYLEA